MAVTDDLVGARDAFDRRDWIATYDATTDCCYYVHSSIWGGMVRLRLRLVPTANGQQVGIHNAATFLHPDLNGHQLPPAQEGCSLCSEILRRSSSVGRASNS